MEGLDSWEGNCGGAMDAPSGTTVHVESGVLETAAGACRWHEDLTLGGGGSDLFFGGGGLDSGLGRTARRNCWDAWMEVSSLMRPQYRKSLNVLSMGGFDSWGGVS